MASPQIENGHTKTAKGKIMGKIKEAYELLEDNGMSVYVPGCYDIADGEEAEFFARDSEAFYKKMAESDGIASDRVKEWAEGASKEKENSFIYFILNHKNKFVKIGLSKNPEARLKILQTASPGRLELLFFIEGDLEVEAAIHEELKQFRNSGEWFDYSKVEVVEYIADKKEHAEEQGWR